MKNFYVLEGHVHIASVIDNKPKINF
jgi:hypothetical protein